MIYLERWKVRATEIEDRRTSEEPHSDGQGGDS